MQVGERALDEGKKLFDEAKVVLASGADAMRVWLATPQGARFRQLFARALILGSPLIFRMRFLKLSPLGRMIEFAGGAAVLIKLAEIIRDWEPETFPKVVDTSGTRRRAEPHTP